MAYRLPTAYAFVRPKSMTASVSRRDGDDVRLLSRKAAELDGVLMLLAFGASEHLRIRRK
jgi:hypothetical protein